MAVKVINGVGKLASAGWSGKRFRFTVEVEGTSSKVAGVLAQLFDGGAMVAWSVESRQGVLPLEGEGK